MKLRGNWIYDSYTLVRETDRSGATAEIATDKIRGEVGSGGLSCWADGRPRGVYTVARWENIDATVAEIDFPEFIESGELFK